MNKDEEVNLKILSKYFDPFLLELLRNPVQLEMKNSCVTTVFWDISSFSKLCKKLMGNPESIAAFLREYFDAAIKVIQEHSGIVDKFIGDGILAYFGYLYDAPDCGALGAIKAAIESERR